MTAPLKTLRVEIASKCAWLLLAGSLDQRLVVQPLGSRQHGRRNLDQIVQRQGAEGKRRRGIDRGEATGQQHFRGGFNVVRQALEDVVKQPDLVR